MTPERVADLPDDCGRCAFWESSERFGPGCGAPADPEVSRGWVARVQREWGDCGRIAYVDGDAIGFAKYAPARYFPRASRMGAGPPSDDAMLVTCAYLRDEIQRWLGDHGCGVISR